MFSDKKSEHSVAIGVREGILLGGRKKFALKITICPKNRQLVLKLLPLIRMGPEISYKFLLYS